MTAQPPVHEVLDKLAFLLERYSLERRASTQPYMLEVVRSSVESYEYDPGDPLVRETLLEHVGSLPVVATALYPHLEVSDIDLGEALVMLAIHDIGELMTGDEITFTKKATAKDPERDAALQLLDPLYHERYDDIEHQTSDTARFAKSVDKLTPDIIDYLTPPEVTIQRMKHFADVDAERIVAVIAAHKRPYMEWSPFLTGLHDHLMRELAAKLRHHLPDRRGER